MTSIINSKYLLHDINLSNGKTLMLAVLNHTKNLPKLLYILTFLLDPTFTNPHARTQLPNSLMKPQCKICATKKRTFTLPQ